MFFDHTIGNLIIVAICIFVMNAGLAVMISPSGRGGQAALLGFLLGPLGVLITAIKWREKEDY